MGNGGGEEPKLAPHLAPRERLSARCGPNSLEISVELRGIEPLTPCLQSRCSSQLSYSPGALNSSGVNGGPVRASAPSDWGRRSKPDQFWREPRIISDTMIASAPADATRKTTVDMLRVCQTDRPDTPAVGRGG